MRAISFLGCLLAVVLSSTVNAALPDRIRCNGGAGVSRAEQSAACTAVIDDAQEPAATRAGALVNRGFNSLSQGDNDSAIRDFNKAADLGLKHPLLFINRANAYFNKGEYDKAFDDFGRAIERNDLEGHIGQGNIWLVRRDYARAVASFTRVLDRKPRHPTALLNRAIAYDKQGDYERALADFERLIQLYPGVAAAFANRGNVFAHKGEYDRAIEDYDRALTLDPRNTAAQYNRCRAVAKKQGQDAEAECKAVLPPGTIETH